MFWSPSVTYGSSLLYWSFLFYLIAKSADRYGNYALHAVIGCVWSMVGFLAIQFIPDNTSRWGFYTVMLFMASTPSWHGIEVAWMSSNLAPIGKRTIALGAVVGAAHICGVPGSQIYQENDAPRFHTGSWINFGIITSCAVMFIFQRFRYSYTNSKMERHVR